ncbi:hypothetical protein KP806_23520 [Paenibacillus sp. N4]|uniref:hypothetical protein n=1 Tax=Paenibacillus vietnamensis TaxID=2590547 RepID=UPI001CD0450C|nr:hypothetical protein [Paenibacillus vietnamensis]MCA0758034.1 hypothetical protein [Paenibacillus vietnamensis]
MEQQTVCPWCMTEIVWDEEIGPEKHCPHCENELSSYRTIELGYDEDEVEEDEYQRAKELLKSRDESRVSRQAGRDEEWSGEEDDEQDDDGDEHAHGWYDQGDGVRTANTSRFAVEASMQRILDDQDEVPECPSCREYMLEAGTQVMDNSRFAPRVAPSLGRTIIDTPFELILYICPSCFQTSTALAGKDRESMLAKLMPAE